MKTTHFNPVGTGRDHQRQMDQRRNLEQKLRMTMKDLVNGTYSRLKKLHIPGTGYPWVQVQRMQIQGIEGYAAIDGYDSFNAPFVKMSARDAVSAIINHHGLFATAEPLRKEGFAPVFLTHHVTDYATLDRLGNDVSEMFDLTLIMVWTGNEIQPQVLPNCRIHEELQIAIGNDQDCLIHRIGRENDLRQIGQYGLRFEESKTSMTGRLLSKNREQYEETATEAIRDFLTQTFLSGLKWGEEYEDPQPRQDTVHEELPLLTLAV